jgi:hypothetical protein
MPSYVFMPRLKRQCNAMQSNVRVSRECSVPLSPASSTLWLRHIAHARCRATDGHSCVQVVDHVGDERDEDEKDDVALHDGGGGGGGGVGVW